MRRSRALEPSKTTVLRREYKRARCADLPRVMTLGVGKTSNQREKSVSRKSWSAVLDNNS